MTSLVNVSAPLAEAAVSVAESTGTPTVSRAGVPSGAEMSEGLASQTEAPPASGEASTKNTTMLVSSKKGNKGTDLRGTVALSIVASSHASLSEALKRLRVEIEVVKATDADHQRACNKAFSTIDSLLIESEAILRDLTTRTSEAAIFTEGDGKRKRQQPIGKKQKRNNKAEENKHINVGIADGHRPETTSAESPNSRNRILRRPGLNVTAGPFGETTSARHIRGPPLLYHSPPARVYRVDETVLQYRSPQFYSIMNESMSQLPLAPEGGSSGPLGVGSNRKPRSFGREKGKNFVTEKNFVTTKNRQLTREKEEAAIRDGLRNATTIREFAELRERANKLGMQFEVAAVNTRVARLQKELQSNDSAGKRSAPNNDKTLVTEVPL